jgi:hypothetical protein
LTQSQDKSADLERHEIPDGEILYRYYDPSAFPPDQVDIPTSIFNSNDGQLSCDWKKYRENIADTIHAKQGRTRVVQITISDSIRNPRNPKNFGKVEVNWHQDIVYNPVSDIYPEKYPDNFAHSLIIGKKKPPILEAIVRNSSWDRS